MKITKEEEQNFGDTGYADKHDKYAFEDNCKKITTRFAFRGAAIYSRFTWLSFFWYFLGNSAMVIFISIAMAHSLYLYSRGYLRSEIHHIVINLFKVPDLSVGMSRSGIYLSVCI